MRIEIRYRVAFNSQRVKGRQVLQGLKKESKAGDLVVGQVKRFDVWELLYVKRVLDQVLAKL